MKKPLVKDGSGTASGGAVCCTTDFTSTLARLNEVKGLLQQYQTALDQYKLQEKQLTVSDATVAGKKGGGKTPGPMQPAPSGPHCCTTDKIGQLNMVQGLIQQHQLKVDQYKLEANQLQVQLGLQKGSI